MDLEQFMYQYAQFMTHKIDTIVKLRSLADQRPVPPEGLDHKSSQKHAFQRQSDAFASSADMMDEILAFSENKSDEPLDTPQYTTPLPLFDSSRKRRATHELEPTRKFQRTYDAAKTRYHTNTSTKDRWLDSLLQSTEWSALLRKIAYWIPWETEPRMQSLFATWVFDRYLPRFQWNTDSWKPYIEQGYVPCCRYKRERGYLIPCGRIHFQGPDQECIQHNTHDDGARAFRQILWTIRTNPEYEAYLRKGFRLDRDIPKISYSSNILGD